MDLFNILAKNSFSVELTHRDKENCLHELAQLACNSGKLGEHTPESIYTALSNREAEGSTGFGDEIAIPHARLDGVDQFILFIAIHPKGVDFDAMDKKRVKVFFVILGPKEGVNEHMQILAAVSSSVTQPKVKRELLEAKSPPILYETFARHLSTGAKTEEGRRKMKLLILVLFVEDFLHHVLEFFITEGIDGATIFDSSGMGDYISNVPLFASFIGFMNTNKNQSKVLLTLIPQDREDEIIKGIESITGDLDKKQGAMIMTLDVSFSKGSMKML